MNERAKGGRGCMLISLLLALAALCPEPLNAQEAAGDPMKSVGPKVVNRNVIKSNNFLITPPAWIVVELDRVEGEPGWSAKFSDAAFDQLIFGTTVNAEVARRNLDATLRQDLEDLSKKYGLSEAQLKKLHLAGKGDLERLFDEVEDFRRAAQSQVIREVADLQKSSKDFSRESARLRPKIHTGPFGKGSLLAKTLKGSLTADQIAAYETWKQDRSAVVTRSWDLRVR